MPHISELYRGQNVHFYSVDYPNDPLHAVIAHIDHAETMDNNKPRVNLTVLLPNGHWTKRCGIPHVSEDKDSPSGKWQECIN